ncbi:uncharacterized protein LOC122316137 [Carya illinoinensis]|uniref:uncharacterized protein LOC122316137 n=1 Tax=Carya illinoinensis TaxID=32201 RepID=UPI001C71C48E|nr:uncharacterized protein LOC122316137 [Carya illinoinensis]
MVKIWKLQGGIQFKGVGTNLFLIEFQNASDMAKVKQGRPWMFDRNLICLEDYNGLVTPEEMGFDKEPIWIQLHNISLGSMTKKVGKNIGELVGEVLEIVVDEEGVGWGPYLPVKTSINITKPLTRGVMSSFNGNRVWIPFRYERLPSFYFSCGIIKHGKERCEMLVLIRSMHGKEETQYEAWLRASYEKNYIKELQSVQGGDGVALVQCSEHKEVHDDVA